MRPEDILLEHYGPGSPGNDAYDTLMAHSRLVAQRAEHIARSAGLDKSSLAFVRDGAMLHDIGILLTNAPALGCAGDAPYIMHGVMGRELLESLGLDKRLALVCETHVGAGLTAKEIKASSLPLPHRDMLPLSIEEKIICVADKFYRKNSSSGQQIDLTTKQARDTVARYGPGPATRFDGWLRELGIIV